jgi:ribosomal protein L11 methyltransferase
MWRQLLVTVDESLAERVADVLSKCGALAVSFLDAGNEPLFEPPLGTTPIWLRTQVVGLFEQNVDLARIRGDLEKYFGASRFWDWAEEEVGDRPWERVWLEHFQPMRFGRRLWVCPSGFTIDEAEALVLRLDPGLAFGTGTHPTTALCLEWLEAADLQGKVVVDYGCGSGILAVAAALLGAERVWAVDIDPQALVAAGENARKNAVQDRIELASPGELPRFESDLLMANILANPLVELADELGARVRIGGTLLLSGILAAQSDTVVNAYRRAGVEMESATVREDWVRLVGKKHD